MQTFNAIFYGVERFFMELDMLTLTFLGTSAGKPTKHRNVTALAIECQNPYQSDVQKQGKKSRPWILVDCGEGTQQQLLHTKLSLMQLQAILITHVHGDHCYGLPGLLSSMAMSGRNTPLTLIAPRPIAKLLDALTLTTELYFTFSIDFIAIEDLLVLNDEKGQKNDLPYHRLNFSNQHQLDIGIFSLSHRVPSYAFQLTQISQKICLNQDKLQQEGIVAGSLWGQLQQGNDATYNNKLLSVKDYTTIKQERIRIVVGGDNDTPELLSGAVNDAMLLIHESTYTQAVADKIAQKKQETGIDPKHSSAKQIAKFAQKERIPYLILTHFSARYQPFFNRNSKVANMANIHQEVSQYYHGRFWLAKDFQRYQVTVDGVAYLN